ncbi:MAG: hypothetical protein E5Y10_27025 [Mesorhizobium sp.]|nr:MAG: hypothetical protein E5Y10_27025 [Mesorhizobium sp.]
MRKRLPKYVSEFQDRHGTWRVRYRRKGQAEYYFRSSPWSPEFMQEYQACLDGAAAPAIGAGSSKTKPGSISALIVAYYGSPEFKRLGQGTQGNYRSVIERFRAKHGDKRVASIERKHIKAILGAMHETPAAADNLLDRLRTLMGLAVDIGMRKDDPTLRMRGYGSKGDGFHTWTEDEISTFEKRFPIGTKARLALALMLYTGQRRSDAVSMGWQHIAGGKIKVRQHKTDARLDIPMHPELRAVMAATPRANLTFLVTEQGKPFTSNGFGNWFADRCVEAAVPGRSHGLRKAAARRLAEAGCSNQQIKAITGHKTDAEVSRYTAAADQSRLAEQAMEAAYGMEQEQKLANPKLRLAKLPSKSLKSKEA